MTIAWRSGMVPTNGVSGALGREGSDKNCWWRQAWLWVLNCWREWSGWSLYAAAAPDHQANDSFFPANLLMAGSDCEFGTFADFGPVDPDIAYAKLAALSKGRA